MKLVLFVVLLAAAVALLDVLAVGEMVCIPTKVGCCVVVVGAKLRKEVTEVEGRVAMYEFATTVLEGETSPVAVEGPPEPEPLLLPFLDKDDGPVTCPPPLINDSATGSGAIGDRPLVTILKAVKVEDKV